MKLDQEYVGVALDGPLKGKILKAPGDLCMCRDDSWWRGIFMGPSPLYAYEHTDKGWIYSGARSY